MPKLVGALGIAFALGACTEENRYYQPEPLLSDECRRGEEVTETFDDFESPDALDILVVVDNTADMERAQGAFADAVPDFLEGIAERGISLRLGVITTDANLPAGLANPGTQRAGCAQNTGAFADSESAGDWTRVAACNSVRTDAGTPRQQALSAIKRNLVDQPDALSEFLRPRARLLLLVLSNEDDCSSDAAYRPSGQSARDQCAKKADELDDIAEWVTSVRAQSITEEGVALAVLSGPPSDQYDGANGTLRPVCQGTFGPAYPANRLWQAAGLMGPFGLFQSLCTDTIAYNLSTIADALVAPAPLTLCPSERLVHEPLDVSLMGADASVRSIPLGESGFLYSGASGACTNGAVRISPSVLTGVEAVEMRYCVDKGD